MNLVNQIRKEKFITFNETNEASSALCTSLLTYENCHLEVSLKSRERERALRKRKANYVSWSVRLGIEDEEEKEGKSVKDIASYNYNKKLKIHKNTVKEVLESIPKVNLNPPEVKEKSLNVLSRTIYKIIVKKDWMGARMDEISVCLVIFYY